MLKVHGDKGATSEDFWTVGNAARWMVLASRVLGLDDKSEGKVETEEIGVLNEMKIGERLEGKGMDVMNVWKMVMRSEMIDGEGELR